MTDERASSLLIRSATREDDAEVLELLRSSLGWQPSEYDADFLWWKHHLNPFGVSPAWVACIGNQIVGYRTMLRWMFERDDGCIRAVRAVDTATHPDHQGRGIFSKLTMRALDDLRAEQVSLVFNTPNDKSRPGYLKMGWQEVGKPPINISLRRRRSIARVARSIEPAEKWSEQTAVGLPAHEVLQEEAAIGALLSSLPPLPSGALRTRRSPAYLEWRYGFGPLAYRAVLRKDTPDDGLGIFRLRRRGAIVEATVCELLVPYDDPRARAELLRRVRRCVDSDVVVSAATAPRLLTRGGPMLTARSLGAIDIPPLSGWKLSVGDFELF
jgi:GNAT superfamily N-acetyltransferase